MIVLLKQKLTHCFYRYSVAMEEVVLLSGFMNRSSGVRMCRMLKCFLKRLTQVRCLLQSLLIYPFTKQPKQTPFLFNNSTCSLCGLDSNNSHESNACVPLQIGQEFGLTGL